jgi:hypothetical protein
MRDAEALTPLFEDASVLITGQRPQLLGNGVINVARRAADGSSTRGSG